MLDIEMWKGDLVPGIGTKPITKMSSKIKMVNIQIPSSQKKYNRTFRIDPLIEK